MPSIETWTRYLPAPLRDRLEGRPNLWRILTNIGWLFGDRILRLGVGLVIGVWVARYLGPESFGLLNYALAYVGLFLPFAVLGFDQIIVRELVNQPDRTYETLGSVFWAKLLAGTVTYGLAVGIIFVLKPNDSSLPILVILTGTILVFQAFDTVDFWFLSQIRSKYSVVARNTSFLVVSAVRLILLLTAAPLIAFAGAVALEALLTAIALVAVYRLSGEHLRAWRITRDRAGALIRTSWPLLLTNVAIAIYMRVDKVMLGEMRGDVEVGIYSAALRLSEVWYIIPAAIVTSVSAAVAIAKKTDEVQYRRRVQQLLNVMAIAGYAVAIPISLLSGPIIALVYGPQFADAGPTLAIHIWAAVFVNLGGAHSLWLINEGRTGYFSVSTAIGAVMNVALNLVLIPHYGSVGAAIATLVSYGVTVAGISLIYKPTRPLGQMILKAMLLRL